MTIITVHSSTEDKTELEFFMRSWKMGDLNANIGREDEMKGVAGRHSIHEKSSENAHMLTKGKQSSSVVDNRAYRGPNCDSDHYVVRSSIVQRLSKTKETPKSTRKNWNIEKLNLKDRSEEYQMSIERKLVGYLENKNRNIDDKWNELETIIKEAAEEEIREPRRERNCGWFEVEFKDAIRNKNQARGIQEAIEKNIKD
ncbi:hypothetical protein J437_LFUL012661 [Ladona fulva]|uniref:Uncharacterized protein n=1 Tax=Ladona fulva TaxID=123851 RepID=A0A8K0KE95_LADFU|nr:hypothetical protein J437_LFUL012661 [Ladona fulva]